MPLRDHFHPPVELRMSWEGFHAQWPAMMILRLLPHLPEGYIAEPGVHLGTRFEVDVGAYEQENWTDGGDDDLLTSTGDNGGTATAVRAVPEPTVSAVTDLEDQHEYEVRVYDQHKARRLVAVVELVSPANKDRPESRRALVTKCAAFLQNGVSVCLVDLVTIRQFNLYSELVQFLGLPAPAVAGQPNALYTASCRGLQRRKRKMVFQAWAYEMQIGQALPTLPLWLTDDLAVPLELDASYEDTCKVFRLPPVD